MKEEDIRLKEKFDKYLFLVEKDSTFLLENKSKFESILCPACNSNKLEYGFKKVGFQYQICKNCNTLFVNPRPNHEQLSTFYRDSKSSKFWIEEFFRPVEKTRTEEIFKPRAKWVADFFGPILQDWTIGDLGAGFGIFLSEFKKIRPNNKFYSIEPNLEQCKICEQKGLEYICDFVENVADSDLKFDLLTSFEVFEHLQNPKQFIDAVRRLLKPGGYFLLTTLNFEGFDIQILFDKSKSVFPPHHLNFFNTNSIKLFFENNGFDVIHISTPGKLDWDIVENMIKNYNIKTDRFWQFITNNGSDELKQDLQKLIQKHSLSSHMRVLCRKK